MTISNIKNIKIPKNPFLLFCPFLVLFVAYVLIFATDGLNGDEPKYLRLAHNLLQGYFSPPAPFVDFNSGPGYPIFLMPFLALHLPLICITLMNAVFHYLSIVLLFKALQQITTFRKALVFSLFWACYYIAYQNMSRITTETLAMFLMSWLILCLVKAFNPDNSKKTKKYIYLAGIIMGYIALIKVIFGYVLLFMLIGIGVLWLAKRTAANYRKGVVIILIAFLTTAPYLIYTYHVTGRIFYWATGSDNLYWMSTPYEDEYGDWKGELTRGTIAMGNYNIPGAEDSLKAHHQKDFDEVNKYTGLERDDAFKKIAVNNIKAHPVKYAKNIFYNIGRLVFHYPYSYAVQRRKSLFVMPINGIMLTFMLLCLIPTFINWRKIIFTIRFMLFFILFYLGGSSLLSSEVRMFSLIVPMLLFWIAFIMEKSVKVSLRFNENAGH